MEIRRYATMKTNDDAFLRLVYDELIDNLYKYLIDNNIKDPLEILYVVGMIHNCGFFKSSLINKNIEIKEEELKGILLGCYEVTNKPVCRHISPLMLELLNKYGYVNIPLLCKLQPPIKKDKYDNYSNLIEHFDDYNIDYEEDDKKNNHVVNLVLYNGLYNIIDAHNITFFCPVKDFYIDETAYRILPKYRDIKKIIRYDYNLNPGIMQFREYKESMETFKNARLIKEKNKRIFTDAYFENRKYVDAVGKQLIYKHAKK